MSCAKAVALSALFVVALHAGQLKPAEAQVTPPITSAVLLRGEQTILCGSQRGLEQFQLPELKASDRLQSKLTNIHDLAFTRDGKKLIVAGGSPGEQGLIEWWNWREQKPIRSFAAHSDVVYRVAFSPGTDSFCSASADGTCCVFDGVVEKPRLTYTGHSRPVLAIGYLNDGKSIVSAGADQTLQLWDATTGDLIRKFDNHLATINDLAVRPAKDLAELPVVATASDDRTVRFWQPTIGRLVRFAKLDSAPRDIAWDLAGKRIIAGCSDGCVCTVDFETAEVTKLEQRFTGRIHTLLVVSESAVVVAGEAGKLELLQLAPDKPNQK